MAMLLHTRLQLTSSHNSRPQPCSLQPRLRQAACPAVRCSSQAAGWCRKTSTVSPRAVVWALPNDEQRAIDTGKKAATSLQGRQN
ncbi:hypothetical protein WJX84_012326 [Apatococcus fuscideae]|uniref:Uncharacterized protein n=1 Tax=Apatococcus fuscideae TaxID=2026836 RepID=A0AAW1RIE6_9CHLO